MLYFNLPLQQFLVQVHGLVEDGEDQFANGPLVEEQIVVLDDDRLVVLGEPCVFLADVLIVLRVLHLHLLYLRRYQVLLVLVVLNDRPLQLSLQLLNLLREWVPVSAVHRLEMLT